MTRALMVRSIPLALSTRDAWKESGAMFARRTSDDERISMLAGSTTPIINLGSSQMRLTGVHVWNEAAVIEPLLTPKASRALLGSLMPSGRYEGAGYYWLKGQGRGGANKEKLFMRGASSHDELKVRATWMDGDVQQHIDGQEYRVITVGEKVVQVTKRDGGVLASDRVYEWVGVTGCDSDVKDVARMASNLLGSDKTIIGWDVIKPTRTDGYELPFILEGNACPGVNAATAGRILDAIEGVNYNGS